MAAVSRLFAVVAILLTLLLYVSGLSTAGLLGPDEPRYASIGREMAVSGDWITPRLWGQPWFEKPALLYWMIAVAFRSGVPVDWAPRLPVALTALAFLAFFYVWLRRQFGAFTAWVASGLLATSALWIGFSHAAVTDLPLAATFCAAVLLVLPVMENRRAPLTAAAALLGLSVLAKGLVPVVLALPFLWFGRKQWKEWLRPAPVIAFLVVVLPWYVACTLRNEPRFLEVFFLQHQLGRFATDALQHVQPFWFYIPVLMGALFPSLLLGGFAFIPAIYQDRRLRFLASVVVFGFVFFSASRNKLAGYLLPLMPLVCVLAARGIELAREKFSKQLATALAVSALLLPLFLVAGGVLPQALSGGLRSAFPVDLQTAARVGGAIPVVIVVATFMMFLRRDRALMLWFLMASMGWIYIEYAALPWAGAATSARGVWLALPEPRNTFCIGTTQGKVMDRAWRYGFNYYSVIPLANCAAGRDVRIIVPGSSPTDRPTWR